MKRILVLLLLLGSCASNQGPRVVRQMLGSMPAPDGVRIQYAYGWSESWSSDVTLVFLHCWGGNSGFWNDQVAEFNDHRTVAIDFPGHGKSGAGRATWAVAGLGADVEAVINATKSTKVILIGHSMGGPVALDVARRMPGRVLGIIAVDTLHDAEFQWKREQMKGFQALFERDFDETLRQSEPYWFLPGTDRKVIDRVFESARAADRRAKVDLMGSFADLDLKSLFSSAKVPIRAVNSAPRPPFGMVTEIERNRLYADFDAVIMEGVGHYPLLERPTELATHLRSLVTALEKYPATQRPDDLEDPSKTCPDRELPVLTRLRSLP